MCFLYLGFLGYQCVFFIMYLFYYVVLLLCKFCVLLELSLGVTRLGYFRAFYFGNSNWQIFHTIFFVLYQLQNIALISLYRLLFIFSYLPTSLKVKQYISS